jgi:hypothetical protein
MAMQKVYISKAKAAELRNRNGKSDEVTSELLTTGEATMAQLAQLFRTDAKTLPKRIRKCLPVGSRKGYRTYDIRDAASYIVKPGYEIEEFIRQMSPQEMPPLLSKEFWNGQNARLKYERELGNLWPTDEVVAFLGQLQSAVKMQLLLVADDVDREEALTTGQKAIVRRIMDGAITALQKAIVEKFKDRDADDGGNRDPVQSDDADDDENILASDDEDDGGNILASSSDEEEDFDI